MNREYWQDKKVIVTGGAGFLGSHVCQALGDLDAASVTVPKHEEYDLTQVEAIRQLYSDTDAGERTVVLHLAAKVGGIGANREHPAEFFYDNLMMGVQLIHEAWKSGIEKFVAIGTVCAYPKFTPVPFKEDDLWIGYPEETNAPYGLAKKMLLVQSQAYRDQYNFNSIFLLPVNLYGPRDNFDPESSHVIPALIKRFIDAKESGAEEVVIWGDGTATREFLYVDDATEGILLATEQYNGAEPVNLGSSFEISIKDLSDIIMKETGFTGSIAWDTSKPNGQPRRKMDTTRAQKEFGFTAPTSFEKGLAQTIQWYLSNRS
jgi:GDP-L-fucose synthase